MKIENEALLAYWDKVTVLNGIYGKQSDTVREVLRRAPLVDALEKAAKRALFKFTDINMGLGYSERHPVVEGLKQALAALRKSEEGGEP